MSLTSKKPSSPAAPASESTASMVYSGVATYGRIRVIIGSIGGGLICLGLIAGGIYIVLHKDNHTSTASALVYNSKCSLIGNNQYMCNFTLTYSANGIKYSSQQSGTYNYPILEGSSLGISYNPNDPNDIMIGTPPSKAMGVILIVSGVIVGLITGLILYFTMKYKEFAAVEGAVGAVHDIARL